MESRAEQAVASPTWVSKGERENADRRRAGRGPGHDPGGSSAPDAAAAALLLGGTAALWAAVLVAVW